MIALKALSRLGLLFPADSMDYRPTNLALPKSQNPVCDVVALRVLSKHFRRTAAAGEGGVFSWPPVLTETDSSIKYNLPRMAHRFARSSPAARSRPAAKARAGWNSRHSAKPL